MEEPEKRRKNIVVNKIGTNASLPPEASKENARARKGVNTLPIHTSIDAQKDRTTAYRNFEIFQFL